MPSPNPDSILDSVKKALGLDSTDTTFDLDVTIFINSALGSLQQLGVGPSSGFVITDNTTLWTDYVYRSDYLGMVKSYMFMKVKLAFDPPDSRFALPAYEKMIEELGWRIVVTAETTIVSNWWLLDGLSDFPTEAAAGDFGFDSVTGNIYVNGTPSAPGEWWNIDNGIDFPVNALVGDFGYDPTRHLVWRKTA